MLAGQAKPEKLKSQLRVPFERWGSCPFPDTGLRDQLSYIDRSQDRVVAVPPRLRCDRRDKITRAAVAPSPLLLSYGEALGLTPAAGVPTKRELEFAVIAFVMAVPAGYWILRTFLALVYSG
jgi:hypothetical protein